MLMEDRSLRVGSLGNTPADVTEQATDAKFSTEGGLSIDEEQLHNAERSLLMVAIAAGRMNRLTLPVVQAGEIMLEPANL